MADDTTLILESPFDIARIKQTLNLNKLLVLKRIWKNTQASMIGKHLHFKEDYGLK